MSPYCYLSEDKYLTVAILIHGRESRAAVLVIRELFV